MRISSNSLQKKRRTVCDPPEWLPSSSHDTQRKTRTRCVVAYIFVLVKKLGPAISSLSFVPLLVVICFLYWLISLVVHSSQFTLCGMDLVFYMILHTLTNVLFKIFATLGGLQACKKNSALHNLQRTPNPKLLWELYIYIFT